MNCPPMPFVPEEKHGSLVILANICWAGGGRPGPRRIAPFLELAQPLANFVKPMPYPGMYPPGRPATIARRRSARTMFVDSIGPAEAAF